MFLISYGHCLNWHEELFKQGPLKSGEFPGQCVVLINLVHNSVLKGNACIILIFLSRPLIAKPILLVEIECPDRKKKSLLYHNINFKFRDEDTAAKKVPVPGLASESMIFHSMFSPFDNTESQ